MISNERRIKQRPIYQIHFIQKIKSPLDHWFSPEFKKLISTSSYYLFHIQLSLNFLNYSFFTIGCSTSVHSF